MSNDNETPPNRQSSNPLLNLMLLIGIVAVAGVVFAALLVDHDPGQPSSGVGGLAPGAEAPPIEAAEWINGPPPDLAGKVYLVDAWATWCRPCWESAPAIVRMYERYHPRGVEFIGLTDEGPDALPQIREFVLKNGIEWPNGYGAVTTLNAFQSVVRPSLWVVGRDGKVVWNLDSAGSPEAAIEAALADPPAEQR